MPDDARFPPWTCADDRASAISSDHDLIEDAHSNLTDVACRIEAACETVAKFAAWVARLHSYGEADAGHAAWASEYAVKLAPHMAAVEGLALDAKQLLHANGVR